MSDNYDSSSALDAAAAALGQASVTSGTIGNNGTMSFDGSDMTAGAAGRVVGGIVAAGGAIFNGLVYDGFKATMDYMSGMVGWGSPFNDPNDPFGSAGVSVADQPAGFDPTAGFEDSGSAFGGTGQAGADTSGFSDTGVGAGVGGLY